MNQSLDPRRNQLREVKELKEDLLEEPKRELKNEANERHQDEAGEELKLD